jgi:hypothetical protein
MAFLLEIRPKTLFFAPTGETGGGSGQNRVDIANFFNLNGLRWQPWQKPLADNKRTFARVANHQTAPP